MTAAGPVVARAANGLRTIAKEASGKDLVALRLYVDGGNRTEPAHLSGLSHYYEHLIFRGGTARQKELETRRAFEAMGDFTGWTSRDLTCYGFTVPPARFDEALSRFADAVMNVAVTAERVQREREVVLSEFKQSYADAPRSWAWYRMMRAAYERHPYGRTTIGLREVIESADVERLRGFHAERYVPNHMVAAVLGAIPPDRAREKVEAAFAPHAPGRPSFETGEVEPAQTATRAVVEPRRSEKSYASIGWKIPDARAPETATLAVLAQVLGGGDASRLERELRARRPLALDAGAWSEEAKHQGLLGAGLAMEPGREIAALRALAAEIARLREEPVPEDELARAKTRLESDIRFGNEPYAAQANRLCWYALLGDPTLGADEIDRIRAVTAEDVRAAARRFLAPHGATAALVVPEDAPGRPSEEEVLAALADAAGGAPGQPEIEFFSVALDPNISRPHPAARDAPRMGTGSWEPGTESLSNNRLRSVPGRQSPPGDPLAARLGPEPRSEVEHFCSTSESSNSQLPVPSSQSPALEASGAAPARPSSPSSPPPPPTHVRRLPNGALLLAREDRSAPVVAATLRFADPIAAEPVDRPGLAALADRLLVRGATIPSTAAGEAVHPGEVLDRAAFAARLDALGLRLSTGVDRDALSVALEAAPERLEDGLDLCAAALLEPLLHPAELEKARAEQLAAIEAIEDDSFALAGRELYAALYPGGLLGRPLQGTAASISAATGAELRAWHRAVTRPDRLIAAVVGDVEPGAALDALARRFGGLPAPGRGGVCGREMLGSPATLASSGSLSSGGCRPPNPPEELENSCPRLDAPPPGAGDRLLQRPREQIALRLGHVGIAATDPDWVALAIGVRAIASEVFFRFVYERGVAYRAWTYLRGGLRAHPFTFEMGVSAGSFGAACAELRSILRARTERGLGEEEIARAKAEGVARHALAQETDAAQAALLAHYAAVGQGHERLDELPDLIARTPPGAVNAALRRQLRPDALVLAAVGDLAAAGIGGAGA